MNGHALDMTENALTMYRGKHLGYSFQIYNLIPDLNISGIVWSCG